MRLKYARGSILADMRKSLGLTQKQVARELNVPNVRLSEIEREVCPHEEIRREYDRYLNAKMSSDKGLDSLQQRHSARDSLTLGLKAAECLLL